MLIVLECFGLYMLPYQHLATDRILENKNTQFVFSPAKEGGIGNECDWPGIEGVKRRFVFVYPLPDPRYAAIIFLC